MHCTLKMCLLEVLGVMLFGIPHIASGQSVSTCERPLGEAILDVNNVRARIVNTGGLFWRGEPHVYNVPKNSDSNAVFASGIWIAGQVGGQLRASATRYGEWEMWAGPLDWKRDLPDSRRSAGRRHAGDQVCGHHKAGAHQFELGFNQLYRP